MTTPYIYEFMYRGRPQNGPGAGEPAWHLLLGQYVAIPGADPQLVVGQAMTPAQAEAAGFPLSGIFADLDAAALASRDAAQAEVARLTQELEAAVGAKAAAEVEAATARRELEILARQHAEATTELATLRAQTAERDTAVIEADAIADREAAELQEANLRRHAEVQAGAEAETGPAA